MGLGLIIGNTFSKTPGVREFGQKKMGFQVVSRHAGSTLYADRRPSCPATEISPRGLVQVKVLAGRTPSAKRSISRQARRVSGMKDSSG